jgi:sugar phosphate permease
MRTCSIDLTIPASQTHVQAWPAASRILLDRVGADELGWYWGLVSISGNVGQGVAPVVLTWLCTLTGSSRTIFVISGVASSTLALAVGCALRLPPPSQPLLLSSENGRSPVAAAKGKGGAVGAEDQQAVAAGASNDVDAQEADACVSVGGEAQALLPRGAWTEVLTSAPIWLMSITNLLIYLPMKACGEWGALIAVQHYGASVLTGASLVACHELGGFLGGCSAPGLSDLLGAARCAHAAAAFCVLGAVAFLSLRQLEPAGAMASDPALPPARRIAIFGLFALAGVGLHGVKALAGLHVARIAPRRASGMAGGLLELLGQVGAACAGWPLGLLATSSVGGWDAAIGVFTVCAVLSTITATAAAMLAAAAAQDKVKTL